MKTSHRCDRAYAVVAFLLVLLIAGSRCLAQAQSMSIQELAQESSAILVGTCTETESYWADNNSKIFTRITLQGEQYLRGDLGPSAEVIVPGGRVGNTIYEVSEMPVFRKGEEVVVFLWQHPNGSILVTGGAQGKLPVETDPQTGKKMVAGVPVQVQGDVGLQKVAPSGPQTRKVPLEDLISEIQSYVKK